MQKTVKIFGKEVTLHLRNDGDLAIANELFLDHQYRFCDQAIKEAKSAVIDIGGHLGFFSLYASLLNPKVSIHAFEPHAGNFALLKENIKENHVRNVSARNLAVSAQAGEIELQISKEDLNHSTVKALEPTGETQKVQATTLSRVFEKNHIGRCDLIKIDCEGAEFEIIKGAPHEILDRTAAIFLEYHEWSGHKSEELVHALKEAGFRVEKYPNARIKGLGFLWCLK